MSNDDFGMWDDEVLEALKDGTFDKAKQMIDGIGGDMAESLGLDDSFEGLFDGQGVTLADDLGSGHFDRGIAIARRALDVEPSAEQVEVSLLRLYRATGAHAAAAEQYGHYASVMREELGIEPPPLETL